MYRFKNLSLYRLSIAELLMFCLAVSAGIWFHFSDPIHQFASAILWTFVSGAALFASWLVRPDEADRVAFLEREKKTDV